MEGLRVSDNARAVLDGETVSGAQSSEGEAGLAGSREQRCPGELGVVVDQRASLGDQSFVSGTGASQKKTKVVVRKESADTREYGTIWTWTSTRTSKN